jgi:hypothetical protein
MNPIIPHWTEYMYRTYLNPIFEKNNLEKHILKNVSHARYPIINKTIDSKLFHYNKYIKTTIKNITETVNKKLGELQKDASKKGGNKKNEEKEISDKEKNNTNAIFSGLIKIYYAPHFSPEQKRVYEILKASTFNENNKITSDYKKIIMDEMKSSDANLRTLTLQFAAGVCKDIEIYGLQILDSELPFVEKEALNDNMNLIQKLTKTSNIELVIFSDETKPKKCKNIAIPGRPLILCD